MCKKFEAVLVVKAKDVLSRVARLGILTSHALRARGTPAQNPNDKVCNINLNVYSIEIFLQNLLVA